MGYFENKMMSRMFGLEKENYGRKNVRYLKKAL
jgi:hypothetical protein